MVRTLIPRLSDPAKVIQPSDWATYWGDIINDYVVRGFGMSLDGGTVTIQTGEARIKGLYLKNDEEQTIDVSDGDYVGILITESSGEASSWNYATNSDSSSLDMLLGFREGSNIVDFRESSKFVNDDFTLYGDGSDGDVIISSDTMLTRDMQYASLTINSGVTVTIDLPSIMIRVNGECNIRGRIVARSGFNGGSSGAANSHGVVGGHGYGQGGRGGGATGGDSGSGQSIRRVVGGIQDLDSFPRNNAVVLSGGDGGFHSYFIEGSTLEVINGRNSILAASGGGGGSGSSSGATADDIIASISDHDISISRDGGVGGVASQSGGRGGRGGSTIILVAVEMSLYDTAEIDVRGEDGVDGIDDTENGGDGDSGVDSETVGVDSSVAVSTGGGGGVGSSGSGGGGCGGVVYIAFKALGEDGDIDVRIDGGNAGALSSDSGGAGGSGGGVANPLFTNTNAVSTSGEGGNVDLTTAERRGVNGEDGEYILTRVST